MESLYLGSFASERRLANGRRFFAPMPKPLHVGTFEISKFGQLVDTCMDTIVREYDPDTTPETIAFQLLRDHYYPNWEQYKNIE